MQGAGWRLAGWSAAWVSTIGCVMGLVAVALAAHPAWAGAGADSTEAVAGRVAGTVGSAPTDADRVGWSRSPGAIMLRSAVIPGWGQWANGRRVKAVAVFLGEGFLITRAFQYADLEREEGDLAKSDPTRALEHEAAQDRASSHRRDFTWWSIFALALSMGDAYVDAHLGRFDSEFRPQSLTESFESRSSTAARVATSATSAMSTTSASPTLRGISPFATFDLAPAPTVRVGLRFALR